MSDFLSDLFQALFDAFLHTRAGQVLASIIIGIVGSVAVCASAYLVYQALTGAATPVAALMALPFLALGAFCFWIAYQRSHQQQH